MDIRLVKLLQELEELELENITFSSSSKNKILYEIVLIENEILELKLESI